MGKYACKINLLLRERQLAFNLLNTNFGSRMYMVIYALKIVEYGNKKIIT